jgi:hypothetical protein
VEVGRNQFRAQFAASSAPAERPPCNITYGTTVCLTLRCTRLATAGFARFRERVNSNVRRQAMDSVLGMTRLYLVVVGTVGFLFGQFFFGAFSVAPTIAGVAGVVAGAMSGLIQKTPRVAPVVVLAAAAGLIGVAMDAHHYYSELDISGNYYAWFLIGPFAAGLCLVGFLALQSE